MSIYNATHETYLPLVCVCVCSRRLTQEQRMMIRFDLWDFEGNHAYAEYLAFR